MVLEQWCLLAMVLMFGGFLWGVWHEASRWMREVSQREIQLLQQCDTREMQVAYSAALQRIGARARLHHMRQIKDAGYRAPVALRAVPHYEMSDGEDDEMHGFRRTARYGN